MKIESLARAAKLVLHFVLPRGFATLENTIRNKQNWDKQQQDGDQRFGGRWTRGEHVERSQYQESSQDGDVKGNERFMQFRRGKNEGRDHFLHPTNEKLACGLQNKPTDQAGDKPGEGSQVPFDLDRTHGRRTSNLPSGNKMGRNAKSAGQERRQGQ